MDHRTTNTSGSAGISQRRFLQLLAGVPLVAGAEAKARPVIDWKNTKQIMDGFGVCAAFHVANNIRQAPPDTRTEILDLLFSQERGAGLSYVRNIVGDGGDVGGGRMWGSQRNGSSPTIEPREGEWNWDGDEEQLWFMAEAASRGCTRHMSTAWTPPAWMKDNGSVIDGSRLRDDKYRAFAEYLSAYVRGYKDHHGVVIDAISPANEPNLTTKYSSCVWTGPEFLRLVRDHIAPVFDRDRITAKLVLGESWFWSEELVLECLADPVARARVDVVAAHAYTKDNAGYEPLSVRTGLFRHAIAAGKPIWQTEVMCSDASDASINEALYWARLMHTHIVENDVAAWFYWTAAVFNHGRTGMVEYIVHTNQLTVPKRLFAIGNYSRFVRPGFVRVESVPQPAPDLLVAAFRDPASSRKVAVLTNCGAVARELRFAVDAPEAALYRTSSSENLAAVGRVRAEAGQVTVTLPAASITSVVM